MAEVFEKLEGTASRLAMTELLVVLFREVEAEEMAIVVNMSLGQLRPKYDRLEFSLAEKMVLRTIAEAFSLPLEEVKRSYKELGDVGIVSEKLKTHNLEPRANIGQELDIKEVYQRLVRIAEEEGQGSQERKVAELAALLRELNGLSGKYVARLVVGKLRLGFSDMTILDALSWLEAGDKSRRKELENAYQLHPDVGKLAQWVKEAGIDGAVEQADVELGVPMIPALAQRLKTANEMIKKMGKVAVEPKFDGTRVQIHFKRGQRVKGQRQHLFEDDGIKEVRTFTRNLDETTEMFPEIQEIGQYVEADELILDSEAVGFDPITGAMLPFQETIKRKRKHGVTKAALEIPLKFYIFDVLNKNGRSLLKEPFFERRKILEETVRNSNLIEIPEMVVTEDPAVLREFHAKQLANGLEGAVVKKWNGVYEPGRRGWSWVKFKEAEESAAKLSDTVDAVVMGLYSGRGKRVSFGVGAFLIGLRTEGESQSGGIEEGKFYTVTKVGTGLSDEQWLELADRAKQYTVPDQPKEYAVDKNLFPDTWLAPGLVVEIAADEVTKSPIHTTGLALRFPRLVRFRDDKGPEQVTSIQEIKLLI